MSRLTMQEVIEHCERTAKRIEDNVEYSREWLKAEKTPLESKRYLEHKQTAEWLKELQRYKDLEEAGRLIELPCTASDEEEFQVVVTMVSKDNSKAFIALDATESKIEALATCIREIFEIPKQAKLAEMGGGCDE